jgi:trk system potassium uptake protein TrkA
MIDEDAEVLQQAGSRLDVLAIQGNGTSSQVLEEAGVRLSDMLIAVTSIDEVNIIACMIAERMGVKTTIARVRSRAYTHESAVLKTNELGISLVIHPEQSTADEIVRLLHRANATDVLPFAEGRILLVGLRGDPGSSLVRNSLIELGQKVPDLTFRVMGISRGVRTILPGGKERLQPNDQVFVLVEADKAHRVTTLFGIREEAIHHVMVLGGTSVGAAVAAALAMEGKRVKLIEPDRDRAEELAEALPDVLIIHGEGSDLDLLATEGIAEMDAFVAVRDDEASNLVTCLMAKHLGVSKTVALLSHAGYIPITQRIGLDAAVNNKLSVSREIMRFLRGKHVLSVATVSGLDVEVLEMQPLPGAKITRGPLKRMSLPYGILIGIVVRGEEFEVATGETEIEFGDRVIVFVLPSRIKELEKYFKR